MNERDRAFKRGEKAAVDYLIQVLIATVCSDEEQAAKFADKLIEVSGGVPPETGIGSGSTIAVVLDGIDRIPSQQDEANGFAQTLKRASRGTMRSRTKGATTAPNTWK